MRDRRLPTKKLQSINAGLTAEGKFTPNSKDYQVFPAKKRNISQREHHRQLHD